MDDMLYDELFESMRLYFPFLAESAIACHVNDNFSLIVKTDRGETILYDDFDHTFRILPEDSNRLSEDDCRNEFKLRLYKIMTRKHITQEELSERTGIPQSAISNYITGRRSPSFYNLDKIAKALGCSLDDFRYI